MHLAWAQGRLKYCLLAILGCFLFCQMPTAQAQTQDTTWLAPVPPSNGLSSSRTVSNSTNLNPNAAFNYVPPSINLYYRVPADVDDVLINQVSGSPLTFTYSWYSISSFNYLLVSISGISYNDLQYLRIGIVITVDDIRSTEFLKFDQLDVQKLSMVPYPNPSQGTINIEIQGNESKPMTLKVLDLLGRCVWKQSIMAVDERLNIPVSLEGLRPGSYWLHLQGSSQVVKPIQIIR